MSPEVDHPYQNVAQLQHKLSKDNKGLAQPNEWNYFELSSL
jgi:hypothetical protein